MKQGGSSSVPPQLSNTLSTATSSISLTANQPTVVNSQPLSNNLQLNTDQSPQANAWSHNRENNLASKFTQLAIQKGNSGSNSDALSLTSDSVHRQNSRTHQSINSDSHSLQNLSNTASMQNSVNNNFNQYDQTNFSMMQTQQKLNGHRNRGQSNGNNGNSLQGSSNSSTTSSMSPNNGNGNSFQNGAATVTEQANGLFRVTIPMHSALSPLSSQTFTPEQQLQVNLMESAYEKRPHPADCESTRPYLPRNPTETKPWHAQVQPDNLDSCEFFDRLKPETLFFIFYYMERTLAQFLAAKALKKQSWRFHLKYFLWFQRLKEPTVINDEFEKGTYIFFDYEHWRTRTKHEFKFEYQYLEDRQEI